MEGRKYTIEGVILFSFFRRLNYAQDEILVSAAAPKMSLGFYARFGPKKSDSNAIFHTP